MALAEAQGFRNCQLGYWDNGEFIIHFNGSPHGEYKNSGLIPIPDYLQDLRMIHAVEMLLDDAQYHKFTLFLSKIAWREYPDQIEDHAYKNRLRVSFSATAEQRCEAVLKALGRGDLYQND